MAEFLSSSGIPINCYDKNEKHLLDLKNGKNFLEFEKGINNYRKNNNNLSYKININDALEKTNICFITVPTPSNVKGDFSNSFIMQVLDDIAEFLEKRNTSEPYIININSTVMPGTFQNELIPYMEKKGFKHDVDFTFLYNPYFVALGDVLDGLENPDFVLVGSTNNYAKKVINELYDKIYKKSLVSNLNLDEAEYTKLLVNAYLTLKISFSNMVKIITKNEKNLSLEKILKVVGSDSRIGSKYMRPGGPFSGPCLPRDVKALNFDAENKNYKNFIATASGKTNDQIIEFLKEDLLKFKEENFNSIIFSGIGYKSYTPSLEETYVLEIAYFLKDNGFKVYFYDEYISEKIPGLNRIEVEKINDYANLIFIPYVDQKFNSLNFNGVVYDIWDQLKGNNVVNKFSDFKKKDSKNNILKFRK